MLPIAKAAFIDLRRKRRGAFAITQRPTIRGDTIEEEPR
jgi:hypothetical protein